MPFPRQAVQGLRTVGGLSNTQVFGDRLHVWFDRGDAAGAETALRDAARRARVEVSGVRAIMPSLEDVFIAKLSSPRETSAP